MKRLYSPGVAGDSGLKFMEAVYGTKQCMEQSSVWNKDPLANLWCGGHTAEGARLRKQGAGYLYPL